MSAFEDVCWHEAGHAAMSAIHGIAVTRIAVIPNLAGTNWTGCTQAARAHPQSKAPALAAGMAGQLARRFSLYEDIDDADRLAAFNRSRDDREQYDQLDLPPRSPLFFEAIETAFATLVHNQVLHHQFVDELCQRRIIGPMVYAEIRARLPVSEDARDADDRFFARLPDLPPAPD